MWDSSHEIEITHLPPVFTEPQRYERAGGRPYACKGSHSGVRYVRGGCGWLISRPVVAAGGVRRRVRNVSHGGSVFSRAHVQIASTAARITNETWAETLNPRSGQSAAAVRVNNTTTRSRRRPSATPRSIRTWRLAATGFTITRPGPLPRRNTRQPGRLGNQTASSHFWLPNRRICRPTVCGRVRVLV